MTKEEKADYLGNFRIECFDISNIQGTNPVGSMVVAEGGIMKKAHYRKFKINVQETPDDFAMMKEILYRRLRYLSPKLIHQRGYAKFKMQNSKVRREIDNFEDTLIDVETREPVDRLPIEDIKDSKLQIANSKQLQTDSTNHSEAYHKPITDLDDSFISKPDLIIIDGGKGQLKQGIEVLHDLKIDDIPVVGLAKRREEVFKTGEKKSYLFDDKKETLFLIQRIRDEAHRFGITYHRLRRSRAMLL
jgi:excinuclease ABC subunit C